MYVCMTKNCMYNVASNVEPIEKEPRVSTSLRDLMLEVPVPMGRPQPQPSPPQRQRPEHYSRIPTSTKEHYVLEKKTESFSSKS